MTTWMMNWMEIMWFGEIETGVDIEREEEFNDDDADDDDANDDVMIMMTIVMVMVTVMVMVMVKMKMKVIMKMKVMVMMMVFSGVDAGDVEIDIRDVLRVTKSGRTCRTWKGKSLFYGH